jgi:hypothetical protein
VVNVQEQITDVENKCPLKMYIKMEEETFHGITSELL